MIMKLDFEQIIPSIPYLAGGAIVTLQYTCLSVVLGFFLALGICTLRMSKNFILSSIGTFYISIFRGTPLLVQLALVYFAIPQLTGYRITAFESGVLAFSLNSAAYVAETIRGGINAVDVGQREAGYALGLPHIVVMWSIIIPQAVKTILPALVNEVINLLKESSLVSVIGEADLLRRANIVAAEKYIYFEPLLVVTIMYYCMVLILSWVAKKVEHRMKYSD
jgi:His/Glu/Gln/Arg/opine family amino acid ABC transporter permease subunit